jgi:hypothetical protein
MKANYEVSISTDNLVVVVTKMRSKLKTESFIIQEFISGQIAHNPRTDAFPDEVHEQVWASWNAKMNNR